MAQYKINDTTLTAIGDAIRNKSGELTRIETVPMQSPTVVRIEAPERGEYPVTLPEVVSNVAKLKVIYDFEYSGTLYSGQNMATIQPVGVPAIRDRNVAYGKHQEIEYDFVYDEAQLIVTLKVSDYIAMSVTAQIYYYDADGNEITTSKVEVANTMTPAQMVDAIDELNTEGITLFRGLIDDSITHVTAEDLKGVTRIGDYTFHNSQLESIELPSTITSIGMEAFGRCSKLSSIVIPEGVTRLTSSIFGYCTNLESCILPNSLTELGDYVFSYCSKLSSITIPANVNKIGGSCFNYCSALNELRILNNNQVITATTDLFYNYPLDIKIWVPSNLYKSYKAHSIWGKMAKYIYPSGEYVDATPIKKLLLFNSTAQVSLGLIGYDTAPQVTVVSADESIATVSNITINEDNTLLTFDINSLATEGNTDITITITGALNTYVITCSANVFETIPESTYEVIALDGVTYGFELNDAGYYQSTNQKQQGSFALCQVNINNSIGRKVVFECINYGEANYDYGVFSKVNNELVKSNTASEASAIYYNFKGKSVTTVQPVEYTDANNECFIQIKYIKDGSSDQGYDSLQFKVRFED